MPQPPCFNEDVSDDLQWVQRKWGLDLAPHQTFELARAVEDPDNSIITHSGDTLFPGT